MRGITVTLLEKTAIGKDAFNKTIYEEHPVEVSDVLVAPANTEDVISSTDLTGKKEVYQMAIPKGDKHDWTNAKVLFWNKTWKTVGLPQEGIEELIPLKWNKKVLVERYE